MRQWPKGRDEPDQPVPPSPEPLGREPSPSLGETEQIPLPAQAAPGRPAVQINVEEDMAIGGGSYPTRIAETDTYGQSGRRKAIAIAVAVLVALFLAVPVLWGLVEVVMLAGVLGSWLWVWIVMLVVLVVATVVIGYHIAATGF